MKVNFMNIIIYVAEKLYGNESLLEMINPFI